jgi:hypothetical protein
MPYMRRCFLPEMPQQAGSMQVTLFLFRKTIKMQSFREKTGRVLVEKSFIIFVWKNDNGKLCGMDSSTSPE